MRHLTRYHDDPKTGLPVAFHSSAATIPLFHSPSANMSPQQTSHAPQPEIDPQLLGDEDEDDGDMGQDQSGASSHPVNMQWHPDYQPNPTPTRMLASQSQQQTRPQSSSRPSTSQRTPRIPTAQTPNRIQPNHISPPMRTPTHLQYLPHPEEYPDVQSQTMQVLTHLTSVTQALLEACTTLTETLRSQGSGRTMNKEDGMDKKQKAVLATEVLANTEVDEEVRRAAAEYLKRLFHE